MSGRLGNGVDEYVGRVYVYQLDLNSLAQREEELAATLCAQETARAEDIISPSSRTCFRVVRGALRQILSTHAGCAPEDLFFQYEAQGKPILKPGEHLAPLHFNVSHSGPWALVAVSPDFPVGADIEFNRPRPSLQKIARRFFHPAELREIESLQDEHARLDAFYRCWTMKEAFVKALGVGIAGGLRTFSTVNTGGPVTLALPRLPHHPVTIQRLPASTGHAYAAVAICHQRIEVLTANW